MMRFFSLASVLCVALLFSACQQEAEMETDDVTIDEPMASDTTMGAPQMMTAGDTIQVTLTEFEIQMPEQIEAGSVTFEVTNEGSVEHNFEIENEQMEEMFESSIAPGSTEMMTLDLQAGTYEVYCPVADHEDRGMQLMLEVTEPAGS